MVGRGFTLTTYSQNTNMSDKAFEFETVAALCSYALGHGPLGVGLYDTMSALDGKRTANSFQHQFRAVLKRAKELKELRDNGNKAKPVVGKPRPRVNGTSPKSETKKRGKSFEMYLVGLSRPAHRFRSFEEGKPGRRG